MSISGILAAVLATLLLLPIHGGGEYLVVFRGKSKHTSLIAPINGWEIPGNELRSCFGDNFDECYSLHSDPLPIGNGRTFRRLSKKDSPANENDHVGDDHSQLERSLAFAAGKCILLHGIFEIWSEGYGVDAVVSKGEISHQYMSLLERRQRDYDAFRPTRVHVAASVLEQPWLTSLQLEDSILSKFEHMWEFSDGMQREGNPDQEILSEKLESPGLSQAAVDSFYNSPSFEELHMRVFLDEKSEYCVLCRMLSRGLAAPSNSGEGGRDPLPLTGSLRRPMSGVLNTFALKSMPFRTPTAMEPEIGFLMANLAGVGPKSRILDPYCGCCSLLLAAAYLQRLHPPHSSVSEHSMGEKEGEEAECEESSQPCLVGVDSCLGADFGPIHANFAAVGLSCMLPSLTLKWDVAESLLQHHTGSGTSDNLGGREEFPNGDFKFDCIITDPPYGMAEAVQSRTSSTSTSTSTPGEDDDDENGTASPSSSSSIDAVRGAVSTLLQLASDRLSDGGRLVFFAPHRQKGTYRDRGKSNILETEVGSESVSYGGPGVGVEGDLNGVGGMESKMAKRKSFKKRTNISLQLEVEAEGMRTVEGVEVMRDCETDSHSGESAPRYDVTGPLDFLPPLPKGLILIGYHQQIMSPTFSRWLCVLQKQKQK